MDCCCALDKSKKPAVERSAFAGGQRPPPLPSSNPKRDIMGMAGDKSGPEVLIYQVLRFFAPLMSRDVYARKSAIESICKAIMLNAMEQGQVEPPPLRTSMTIGDHHRNGCKIGSQDDTCLCPKPTLRQYLPIVLMHSYSCPFDDVRERFTKLLRDLNDHGIKVPRIINHVPTRFLPVREISSNTDEEEQTQMLFIDAFLQNNRLDHVTQVMGYHPQYLECFLRSQHFMLRGDGPLPYDYRHYIAMIAAGRHQCSYLINLQKQEFLLQGGNPRWLQGLDHIPQKLRDLYEINKVLAHRPWLVNRSHIQKLTKGKDSWSVSEVVHAIVLLAHFHSLSSFVFGCGINAEIDENDGHTFRPPSLSVEKGSGNEAPIGSPTICEMASGVEVLMQRMKSLSEQAQEETSLEELVKRFEKVESQAVEISAGRETVGTPKADISCFIDDPKFQYQDFAKRGEVCDIPTFRVQDYSWDDHGFSLVNGLYSDVGNLLDEKFKTAYGLTYYTMGTQKHVDTTTFRRAIWNYIHCIFGIRHDDYDYGEVNQLLERDLKSFIKSVCCFPEQITKENYDSVMRDFRHSEKVHVNLMMLEARMQAELLYALRAIMRYMT